MYNNPFFSKKPEDFFKNLNKLPEEMLNEIYAYVPKIVKVFLTKDAYLNDHLLVKKTVNKREMENYIRSMIRQDNDFVFSQLMKENQERWTNMRKYYYKNGIHSNYLVFLESYAIDNESTKCRKIIGDFFQELGLSKNQHKKNTIKYIRWKT